MYTKVESDEVAPINKLHEDLLRLIFIIGCNAEDPKVAIRCAVRISRVCSYWRAVALGETALWARLDILNTNRDLIQVALERSGSRPVAIYYPCTRRPSRRVRPLDVDLLRQQWSRVQELYVSVQDTGHDLLDKLCAEVTIAPELRVISLQSTPGRFGSSPTKLDCGSLINMAPTLRRITFVGYNQLSLGESLGCTNLTSIKFHSILQILPSSFRELCRLIRASPLLVDVDVHCKKGTEGTEGTDASRSTIGNNPIHLPYLRSFKVDVYPPNYANTFLRAVVLPASINKVRISLGGDGNLSPPKPHPMEAIIDQCLLPPTLFTGSEHLTIDLNLSLGEIKTSLRWAGKRDESEFITEIAWHGYRPDVLADVLTMLDATQSISGVHDVTISCRAQSYHPLNHMFWGRLIIGLEFLARLPALSTLSFQNWHVPFAFLDRMVEIQRQYERPIWGQLKHVSFNVRSFNRDNFNVWVNTVSSLIQILPALRCLAARVEDSWHSILMSALFDRIKHIHPHVNYRVRSQLFVGNLNPDNLSGAPSAFELRGGTPRRLGPASYRRGSGQR